MHANASSCQVFCTPHIHVPIYLEKPPSSGHTRIRTYHFPFLWFYLNSTLICTLMHLSQPPVKNMLSSKGWNLKAKTFLPCPDSGAKMSSLLQKTPMTQNRPFQICHLPQVLCVKMSLSAKSSIRKSVSPTK